jgi:2'-5' RNA ligase
MRFSVIQMSSSYLIEIRLFGKAKYEIRELNNSVPHITLVGGFSTINEERLIKDFNLICCCTGLLGYIIEGKDYFKETGIIYLDVQPSKELIDFRRELRERLRKYCTLSEWDFVEPFKFHVTIANHIDQEKIRYIMQNFDFDNRYNHRMLRATLLKNGKILCEYDFLLKRMLNRSEALNKQVLMKTMSALKEGKTKKKVSMLQKLLCYVRLCIK